MDLKAYRFQLRARPSVEAQLRRFAGMGRWVWCRALDEQRARHARGEKYAGHAEMCKWLTAWRNDPTTAWLADGPIHPQQQVLRRLDEACRRFFTAAKAGGRGRGAARVGPPQFRRRGEEPGIRFPDPKQFALDAANGRIKLPKLGFVRLRMSQPVEGVPRNVSITREGERWFASIQVETNEVVAALGLAPTLGIDLGLAAFAATSDGALVAPLKAAGQAAGASQALPALGLPQEEGLGQPPQGSGHARQPAPAQRLAAQAHDRHGRPSSGHRAGGPEDQEHVGFSGRHGRSSWAHCARQGGPEPRHLGCRLGRVRAAAHLQGGVARRPGHPGQPGVHEPDVPVCGHEAAENRKTQSVFSCVAGGHTENADVHAAKNILAAGHAVWSRKVSTDACAGEVSRASVARAKRAAPSKQEPTEAKVLV
jgi:putative transposase